jgi:hypothetical protein
LAAVHCNIMNMSWHSSGRSVHASCNYPQTRVYIYTTIYILLLYSYCWLIDAQTARMPLVEFLLAHAAIQEFYKCSTPCSYLASNPWMQCATYIHSVSCTTCLQTSQSTVGALICYNYMLPDHTAQTLAWCLAAVCQVSWPPSSYLGLVRVINLAVACHMYSSAIYVINDSSGWTWGTYMVQIKNFQTIL